MIFNTKNNNSVLLIKLLFLLLFFSANSAFANPQAKQTIKALYIPLADHYAALVAYERYRDKMKHASFEIIQMKNWDLLRAYFQTGEVDMAYVMSPLAMDMYSKQPDFKWIGLMHRDGNALAINSLINNNINLAVNRVDRKPNDQVAIALTKLHQKRKVSTQIGMPHLLSTHSVVLYQYLKNHGVQLTLTENDKIAVQAIAIAPPKAPAYIKGESNRLTPAAFEQSLPWADIVETQGFGHVAWYSKDVLQWEHGHVECIALATNHAIETKYLATKEVMDFIKIAGDDIEKARNAGGVELNEIVHIVQKHIPAHTKEAIIASLDPKLRVINYQALDIDKAGLKLVMDLAVEAGILKQQIDIDSFSAPEFDR